MSGWIKLEKDLYTDPRVFKMARALDANFLLFHQDDFNELDPCNAQALPGVTLVVGALAVLWFHADTHLRGDDILDLGADEIDELVGVKGFCKTCPADWLQVVDAHSVKLPGFHVHNGTEARQKALTQKRVAQHRNTAKPSSVTGRNARPLPDRDLDQDHIKKADAKNGVGPEGKGRNSYPVASLPGESIRSHVPTKSNPIETRGKVLTPADLKRLKAEIQPGEPRFPLKMPNAT